MSQPLDNTRRSASHFKKALPLCLCLPFLLPGFASAEEHHLIEAPVASNQSSDGVLKNSWVVDYRTDDFTDVIKNATVLFIPEDYSTQKAFFMRCNDFFSNFSVQYIENESALKNRSGTLPNASSDYIKHGYLYDDKQRLTVKSSNNSVSFDISVGGQNNSLSNLFKTDIEKQPGLLGMSLHTSFTYKEMPSFKADRNSSDLKKFFALLKPGLAGQDPLHFELVSDQGQKHTFSLDVKRMNQFVPKEVMDYCFTDRELRE